MHAYMHTCIHALHTLHTYMYTYTHCSCMTIGHVTRCISCFLAGRQGSTLATTSISMAATACQMRRKTSKAQPQLRINCVQMHNGGQARLNRNCGSTAKEDTTATANKCRRKGKRPTATAESFPQLPTTFHFQPRLHRAT